MRTVNISFSDNLLREIDDEARRESRSRSEFLREAARLYVRRQRQWDDIFALGDSITNTQGLTEADIKLEISRSRTSGNG